MPRGLTAVRALLDAGVVVAAGADNLQDPFNPLGRACPFETAALMVLDGPPLARRGMGVVSTRGTPSVHRRSAPDAAPT